MRTGSDPSSAALTATAGNELGRLITYGTGRFGNAARRWLRISQLDKGISLPARIASSGLRADLDA